MKRERVGLFVMIFVMFTSVALFGSFNGQWQGTGGAKDGTGWNAPCDPIDYQFEQTPETLYVVKGKITCGEYQMDVDSVSLKIKDQKLYYEDLELGTITDDRMKIMYEDPDVSLIYEFKKRQENGQSPYVIDYTQTESNEGGILAIEGRLFEMKAH